LFVRAALTEVVVATVKSSHKTNPSGEFAQVDVAVIVDVVPLISPATGEVESALNPFGNLVPVEPKLKPSPPRTRNRMIAINATNPLHSLILFIIEF